MVERNPRPAHERLSAFTTLYFRGTDAVKDKDGNVISPAVAAGPYELFPIDAKQALARDPELWSTEPHDDAQGEEADPGDESRQSAHGNTPEEIRANDAATSMRQDGYAAEPAGSQAGVRPGAYSPSRVRRTPAPVTIVDPAKDQTNGPGNDPAPGDTNIAGNRGRRSAPVADDLA
jgi:hypothetical protein